MIILSERILASQESYWRERLCVDALEAVADAARGVVEGTDADRPTSLSTMSLMALADALDELDKEAADGRSDHYQVYL